MPASTQANARPETTVEALRQRFLERSAADLILLLSYPDDVSREELGFIVHRLAGAAGVFGYPELSVASAELEIALAARLPACILPIGPLARTLAVILAD